MRPFVLTLPGKICSVTPAAEGYAVTHEQGIELLSPELAQVGVIPAAPGVRELWGDTLRELPDGRVLACSRSGIGFLFVGRRGGVMEPVIDDGYVLPPLVTPTGFVAAHWHQPKLWVDDGGVRRELPLPIAPDEGIVCGDRLILQHETKLVAVDASGKQLAEREVPRFSRLLSLTADFIAMRFDDDTAKLLDPRSLADLQVLPVHTESLLRVPLLVHGGSPITVSDTAIEYPGRWKVAIAAQRAMVVGDFVVASTEDDTRIISIASGAVAQLAIRWGKGDAVALGDGVVVPGTPTVWWRPGAPQVELEHDFAPELARAIPDGVATADRRQLYVWRRDVDGPEVASIATTTIPFDVPVIANGDRVIVRAAKRFSLLCELNGVPWPLEPDAAWRHVLDADAARAIVDRLLARDFAGDIPAIADRGAWASAQLRTLPPAELVSLHGRALFDRKSLSEQQRNAADMTRDKFLSEICEALRMRPRVLLAGLHARDLAHKPPRTLPGYDYLGAFETGKRVWVADPCYFNARKQSKWLGMVLDVKPGTWHAYVRGYEPTAEFVAVHADGFAVDASKATGSVGVDAGCAGVFDDACPKIQLDFGTQEATWFGRGALAFSGHGDGGYPVFTGKLGTEIAKIRIGFVDGSKRDRAIAVASSGRAYSPKQQFSLGEAIAHPTFGIGTVTAVNPGKIDVAFADGTKTLIHGRA